MKPKAYISACQTVERLLNVTSQVSLRDLAIKFDCLEVEDLAREVERRWVLCERVEAGQLLATSHKQFILCPPFSYKAHAEKKYTTSQKEAMDFSKPVYATAALYTACKCVTPLYQCLSSVTFPPSLLPPSFSLPPPPTFSPSPSICTINRLLKIRCDKSKFQTAAMCTRSVFQNILEEMNECAPKNIGNFNDEHHVTVDQFWYQYLSSLSQLSQ